MQDNDMVLWGIHGGRTCDADTLFLRQSVVAVGWAKAGNLGQLKADREAFKKVVAAAFPDEKPGAIPNYAGQLYRFVHEVKPGDLMVYPSKRDRQLHIGRVTGPYHYDPDLEPGYPNLRPVKWLSAIPRTRFSQRALYEIGSAMSLFQIKSAEGTIGDPIVSALYGKEVSGEFGLLVTLGTFTNHARNFARSKSNLRLVDGNELVDLILQHYEQFDSRYKGLLPLKRVYVPEALEEAEE
jgi:predicted Mrr-cat superfamily restriction endonuclease